MSDIKLETLVSVLFFVQFVVKLLVAFAQKESKTSVFVFVFDHFNNFM